MSVGITLSKLVEFPYFVVRQWLQALLHSSFRMVVACYEADE